jgi:hypothetical protein
MSSDGPEGSDLTATLPPDLRGSLTDWLWGVRRPSGFSMVAAAQLTPLLADLPPPHTRSAVRLRPLDAAALRSFELRPSAPAPAAAPSAPVDIRLRIWELAHVVHDTYTNHWPHTWARPAFANDPANPTQAEWAPCAEQLIKSPGCKATLEKWRDAAETAPKTYIVRIRDAHAGRVCTSVLPREDTCLVWYERQPSVPLQACLLPVHHHGSPCSVYRESYRCAALSVCSSPWWRSPHEGAARDGQSGTSGTGAEACARARASAQLRAGCPTPQARGSSAAICGRHRR